MVMCVKCPFVVGLRSILVPVRCSCSCRFSSKEFDKDGYRLITDKKSTHIC